MNTVIDHFVDDKKLALVGVSTDKRKFGNYLFSNLSSLGYTIFPVHQSMKEIDGVKCYESIERLPCDVENLIIAVRPASAEEIVESLKDSKIKRVWFHRGSGKGCATPNSIARCKELNIEVVEGVCPNMYLDRKGIHKFHFLLRKHFGKLP